LGNFLQDLKYAVRMLFKNPGFAAIAIVTLALGIGANTAIFSVVNAELLRPLPFRDPSRLVRVWSANLRLGARTNPASYPDFADWRSQNHVFENMAAYTSSTSTLTGVEKAAHLDTIAVSAEIFTLLGATPQLGRTFLAEEDQAHHHVAILSDVLWRQQFGSDPGIIGRTITLDGSGYTVVGVMPAGFQFPLQREPVALWTTFSAMQESADNTPTETQQRGAHFLNVIARLKPGVALGQARAAMDVIASSLRQQYPDTDQNFGVQVFSEQDQLTGSIRPALIVMLAAVGLVLLIACVNVANLLLARATTRTREIAIRAALGAGRKRVVLQLLTESLLLALLAGIFGVIVAAWGSSALVRLSPGNLPRATGIHIDGWVLAFTFALSILTGVLFGLVPAFHVVRSNLVDSLKEGSLSTTAGIHRHRARSSLVIVEIALALVLLVSAGLLIRSLVRLQDVNPGFDPKNVMASDVDLPSEKYPNEKQVEFARELMLKLSALPGIESAAGITPLPMSGGEFRTLVEIEGRPVAKSEQPPSSIRIIAADYFRTMRIPLLQGRQFTQQDSADANPVVIVNESLARQFFPGENPIGKHIRPGISADSKPPRMREIVGVVGNVKFRDLATDFDSESYIPWEQLPIGSMTIIARAENNPYALAKPIGETVRSIDPDIPTYNSKTVESYLAGTIAAPRFNTFLLTIFAGLALLLTAIGLYGVISYSVAQRTHEIGIRMALGAEPSHMLRLVIGQGLRIALVGVGLGLVAAIALTRFLSSLLFGVTSSDPLSFASVVALLLGVVLFACYIPARRAMRVDPMVALRHE
jgi:putative ABC transport system permease protein